MTTQSATSWTPTLAPTTTETSWSPLKPGPPTLRRSVSDQLPVRRHGSMNEQWATFSRVTTIASLPKLTLVENARSCAWLKQNLYVPVLSISTPSSSVDYLKKHGDQSLHLSELERRMWTILRISAFVKDFRKPVSTSCMKTKILDTLIYNSVQELQKR